MHRLFRGTRKHDLVKARNSYKKTGYFWSVIVARIRSTADDAQDMLVKNIVEGRSSKKRIFFFVECGDGEKDHNVICLIHEIEREKGCV